MIKAGVDPDNIYEDQIFVKKEERLGLATARARGRNGGRKFALTKSQLRLAEAAMSASDTKVSELCKEIGVHTLNTLLICQSRW